MQPGNNQHVISARALKVHAFRAFDECPFANDHCVDQSRNALWPELMNVLEYAAMRSGSPQREFAS